MDTCMIHATVYSRGRFLGDHAVGMEGGRIAWIGPSSSFAQRKADHVIDFSGDILAPGYIDMHIHGAGSHLADRGKKDIEELSRMLPRYGTTSFLPTIIPHPPGEEVEFLRLAAQAAPQGAGILGFFMEGPFIAKTGAIHPSALTDRTADRVRTITDALRPHRVVFAISPELACLEEVMGVMTPPVFITHTQAGVSETQRAIALGARHATHFYDVFYMPEESDPGVRPCGAVEAILSDPSVSVDFILDGEHVDPVAVKLALACKKPDKVCLITDSNIGAGLPPGVYQGLGGDEIRFSYPGGPARGTERSHAPGTLYGSGLTLDKAVRNAVSFGVATPEVAITMASASPAKVLGVYGKKGDIDEGFDADVLRLSHDLEVVQTWVGGREMPFVD